ncbi:hypothetical protein QUF80_11030 [Desulfococcaceae bacterium HSG8]|nr:hypothetical protein [Desulfococcaceae bacterium HSG8]
MEQEKLDEILRKHKEWLESDGEKWEMANFSGQTSERQISKEQT